MEHFRTLTKFAFESYHEHDRYLYFYEEGESKKVTFFKEDIPEGLVHFGFMNESTEMYAAKEVERIFSFLHLSLQEYLAAWHLANNYSIEFQVAYHRLAVEPNVGLHVSKIYKGDNREEEALILSLEQQRSAAVEPALFLAGITGWKSQSDDDRNRWEIYLSHDTAKVDDNQMVLLRSLYEAQNTTILSQYFLSSSGSFPNSRSVFTIGSSSNRTPYDCYTLSYCLSQCLEEFRLFIDIKNDDDVSLFEIFVKGLDDHCKSTRPRVTFLKLKGDHVQNSVCKCIYWLNKTTSLTDLGKICLESRVLNSAVTQNISLAKIQSLEIYSPTSWEWLDSLKSLTELKALRITSTKECSLPPTDLLSWLVEHRLTEIGIGVKFPSNPTYHLHNHSDVLVDSLLKSVLRSNQITKVMLPYISHETMAGVHSILLYCPSLVAVNLGRARLGFDGILYICSALRKNKTLRHLQVRDDLPLPPLHAIHTISFSSMERAPLPAKTTVTDFLLELNSILKDNTNLEDIKIESGLFLPLSFLAGGDGECNQWTGLGPLQHFNVGAIDSGMSPNLRRSFSSSDLTQPKTTLFWERQYLGTAKEQTEVDFKKLFSIKKKEGKKLFSLPSFTAPDIEVLQSFSGLDPRLKECLEISNLHQYMERLRETTQIVLTEVSKFPGCSM